MAKMTCKCGKNLNNQSVPNNIELIVYSDYEWDEICKDDVIHPWLIPSPKYEVWRCPECKRIYVYDPPNNIPIMVYSLESN